MTETPVDVGMVSATPSNEAPAAPQASHQGLTQQQRENLARSNTANPRSVGHSPARDRYEQMRADPAPATPAAPTPAGEDQAPRFQIGKHEVTEEQLGQMMERQAQDDLRKATLPATPEDYRLELPADFKAPGGVEFKLDEAGNKATFDALRNYAHTKGWDNGTLSEVLGLYASHVAAQDAALAERSRAEIAKVGPNGPQRVDAVGRWITSMVGEADAKPIRATIVTDAHLRFYENVMQKINSQGTAPYSSSHRVPPDTKAIPGYDKMSFEQRRQAQDQLALRR